MTDRTPAPRPLVALVALAASAAVAGCEPEHEFERPDREERVQVAESLYSPALFDTVAWQSGDARALEGNLVYSARCRQCHGPLGRGETEYGAERDLAVPSLVAPDWEYAADLDAAAFYIVERLRPQVLGEGGR